LVFGPSRAAARLESSKTFTKEICDSCGAPTAAWARFTDSAPPMPISTHGRAHRGQGRWARGRQRRHRRHDRSGGPCRHRRHPRRRLRGGRRLGRDRGVHDGRGGQPVRPVRRHRHARHRHGPGSQAHRRGRHRPQHRRHGRLFPRPDPDRRHGAGRRHGPDRGADRRRNGPARHALYRGALRRPHDRGRRPRLVEYNVALRRSRMPGPDDAPRRARRST
jgi:hypothetical protein